MSIRSTFRVVMVAHKEDASASEGASVALSLAPVEGHESPDACHVRLYGTLELTSRDSHLKDVQVGDHFHLTFTRAAR
jgi:hypothetical protein